MDKLRKTKTGGFSTIELMIALAILSLVLTAVILVSFGNQSFLIGTQTSTEAMKKAQGLIEEAQANARKDFNLVNSTPDIDLDPTGFCFEKFNRLGLIRDKDSNGNDDIYCKRIDVSSNPSEYFLTKEITALIMWKNEMGLAREMKLSTLLANFDSAVGGNTCNSNLSGDWSNPEVTNNTTDFASLIGDSNPLNAYTLSDVDAYRGKLYVTAYKTTNLTDPTFFVFDIDDGDLNYKGSVDTSGPSVGSAGGPSSVVVAKNNAGYYAYIANGYKANFGGIPPTPVPCTEGMNCSQLQVVDVSSPSSPNIVRNFKLANITSNGAGAGNTVFYKNGYIYLGLTSTGNNLPEFNIIDVHTPNSPINLGPGEDIGSHDINAILVKGLYAYVVAPDTEQLKVIDISNPLDPEKVSGWSGTGGNGKSIYDVGDSIYLGTATGNGSRYHLIDAQDPENLPATSIEKSFPASVDGVIVRDNLAFVLTKTALQIINAVTTTGVGSLPLTGSSSSASIEPAFDCEGNYLFTTFNDSNEKGHIYVITSDPTP